MCAGRPRFPLSLPPRLAGALLLLTLPACGGDGLLVPGDASIARLHAVAGDGQEAVAGEPVPEPLVVEALDEADRPVTGARVAFRFINTDGEVTPGMAETGVDGRATAEVTLGGSVGDQVVEARLEEGGLAVEFRLTALRPEAPPGNGGGHGNGGNGGGHGNGGRGDSGGDGGGTAGSGGGGDSGGKGEGTGKDEGKGKDNGHHDGDHLIIQHSSAGVDGSAFSVLPS